jgi:hypothetical protein
MIDTRIRIIAIVSSLALLVFIVELVRRRKLKEEYSVLWIATGMFILILALSVRLLQAITDALGAIALSTTLFFFGLMFAFFMLLHFSVRMSAMERRMTQLVQEIALRDAKSPDQEGEEERAGDMDTISTS